MTKSNQSSLDIADHLSRGEYDWCPEAETRLKEQHDLIRQQQAEIETLKQSKSDGNNKVNLQLTQEEILDIWYEMKDSSNDWTRYVDFARAILRKAQDK